MSQRVHLLGQLLLSYAWCRIPPFWSYSEPSTYLLVIRLPDGRRYWRCLDCPTCTPDRLLLAWATCPPVKWAQQFRPGGKGSHHWTEFFDFWKKP